MKKLCIFTDVFPPQIGGGTFLESTAKHLSSTYQVLIITGPLPNSQTYPPSNFFKIQIIDHLNEFTKNLNQLSSCLNQLHTYLTAFNPDIVYVNNYAPQLLLNFLSANRKFKIAFSCHNTPTPDIGKIVGLFPDNKSLEINLGQYILTKTDFDLMIAPSLYYFNWWYKLGVPKNKIALNYLGIDTSLFCPSPITATKPTNRLLCVSRLVPRKGIQDALNALTLLPRQYTLDIVTGLGNYTSDTFYHQLIELIRNLKLETRVNWHLNKYSHSQMPQVYQQAGITLVPSHFEGLGLVTLEAMACGCPVIATNVAGTNEIIKPDLNCLAIEPQCPQSIAQCILKIASNPKLRKDLTYNALADIKSTWDIKYTLTRFEKIFTNLTDQNLKYVSGAFDQGRPVFN